MIKVNNLQLWTGVPFDQYLDMPGRSFSSFREAPINPTVKMRFGSLVDAYLFEPATYTGEYFSLVQPVARAVKERLGPLLSYGKPQLCITAEFIADGLRLYFKGRVDLFAKFVIDMKVSELDLVKAIAHFRYDHQVSGYAIALQSALPSVIISVNPKTHAVTTLAIPTDLSFWLRKVKEHGDPI